MRRILIAGVAITFALTAFAAEAAAKCKGSQFLQVAQSVRLVCADPWKCTAAEVSSKEEKIRAICDGLSLPTKKK
jgi:hypothetical protein